MVCGDGISRAWQVGPARSRVLAMGTMTAGGGGEFADVRTIAVEEARRQVGQCLEVGINLFDTADEYSRSVSEEILGNALKGRRDQVLIATKVGMPVGDGPNDGLSSHHIVTGCEASLRRLGSDHNDPFQMHRWDGLTSLEETLAALDLLVCSGKVRYVGASNYTCWQLMKSLGIAAAELVLTAGEREQLDSVSALPLLYPYWHQANTGTDRLSPADLVLLGRDR